MATTPRTASVNAVALWVLAVLATIFFLRAASSFLIPIALGVLISYPLEPVVAWLERHRVPRGVGAGLLLLAVLGAAAASMSTLRDDAKQLLQQLPQAAEQAREMVVSQLGLAGDAIQATSGAGQSRETDSPSAAGELGAIGSIGEMSGSLLQLGATTIMSLAGHLVVIVFLVFFLLLSGNHFRKRIVEIFRTRCREPQDGRDDHQRHPSTDSALPPRPARHRGHRRRRHVDGARLAECAECNHVGVSSRRV